MKRNFKKASTNLLSIIVLATALQPSYSQSEDENIINEIKNKYQIRLNNGQYMKGFCYSASHEEWPSVELLRCTYKTLGARATVTLALPDATRLARWTVTACRDANASDIRACARHIERRIWSASNAQFPVRGYVIEPRSVLGGSSQEPYCFLFRDGVTVRTKDVTE